MPGPFPPESTPSRVGFGADLAWAARALIRQPSVPLVSVAGMLLLGALSTHRELWIGDALWLALLLFLPGWCGAERVFFQRHLQGRPVLLPHFLRLVKPFLGRFLMLGFWCG